MAVVRSTPMPVSTLLSFMGSYVPAGVLRYCMKTSFHTSKYLPQEQPGLHPPPHGSFPVS